MDSVYSLVSIRVSIRSCSVIFFFQAEDGIRDLVRSRGLGDVYKRQECIINKACDLALVQFA